MRNLSATHATRTVHTDTGFRYVDSWHRMTQAEAEAVQAFWLRENAHVEGVEAARRVHEIAIRTFAADGELAAISTAEPRLIPRLMQPMYYYRCFVGAAWRDSKILNVRTLLHKTVDALEVWSRERGFPCIGVLLELENERFGNALRRAYWSNQSHNGYSFIGRSARGLDMRVRYFIGARLKTPEQVAKLLRQAGAEPATTDQRATAMPTATAMPSAREPG
jgi:hypothetical protein